MSRRSSPTHRRRVLSARLRPASVAVLSLILEDGSVSTVCVGLSGQGHPTSAADASALKLRAAIKMLDRRLGVDPRLHFNGSGAGVEGSEAGSALHVGHENLPVCMPPTPGRRQRGYWKGRQKRSQLLSTMNVCTMSCVTEHKHEDKQQARHVAIVVIPLLSREARIGRGSGDI